MKKVLGIRCWVLADGAWCCRPDAFGIKQEGVCEALGGGVGIG